MFRGIYSAATGIATASRNHDVTAYNIAHGTMPGFRQHGVINETFEQTLQSSTGRSPSLIGSRVAKEYVDFRTGGLQETKTSLDLALKGEGFFVVQGPNGPLFTRDGVLQRTIDGQLLNTAGYPILGSRGPIRIPPQTVNLVIAQDGSVHADGQPVDTLQQARFRDVSKLIPVGTTLFRAPTEAGQEQARGEVLQGYREQSNVQYPVAMVSLITEMRYLEAAQRALRTISDSIGQVTRAA
jgi:flagellar basal body rod protein FlgG